MKHVGKTTGKNILVSGGSRGLGLALVTRLLEQGNNVATFARKNTKAIDKLKEQYGDKVAFVEADGREYAKLNKFLGEWLKKVGGRIDGLVNNAAIGQDHLLSSTPPEKIHEIVEINIEAPIQLTRLVVKRMLIQGCGGQIVNISSICGSRGYTGLTAYCASKGAMDAFTRSLARELGARQIFVNSVCPGFFESDMSAVLLPEQLDTIKRRTPVGTLATDENVAEVVDLLLAGTTHINGQQIFIDGGTTI